MPMRLKEPLSRHHTDRDTLTALIEFSREPGDVTHARQVDFRISYHRSQLKSPQWWRQFYFTLGVSMRHPPHRER